MKRKSTILTLTLALVLALACGLVLTACGGKGKEYNITWDVPSTVTVKVEGQDGKPATAKKDDEIKFSLTPANGWAIDSVKVTVGSSTSNLRAQSGSYTVKMGEEDIKISVTVKEVLDSIEVTTPPTKKTYKAGETLDTTGMVVTARYKTERTEEIAGGAYTIVYGESGASTFLAGDTSFKVRASGVESAAVQLEAAVKGTIKLDLSSGTLSDEWYQALAARTDLTASKDAGGNVVIEYEKLTAELTLPTDADITRGKEGEFEIGDWRNVVPEGEASTAYQSVAATTNTNLDLKLNWKANLLHLSNLEFRKVTDHATLDDGVYLVLTARFFAVDSAAIYLYEGNDEVELTGDTYTATGDGEEQELFFKLDVLGSHQSGGYNGKWMDLCFRAEIDGEEFTQSFEFDQENPLTPIGLSIHDSTNSYTLLTHHSNNKDWIKLAFKPWDFTYAFDVDPENPTELVVSGEINTAKITDFATQQNVKANVTIAGATGSGAVDAEGKFSVTLDMTKMAAAGATTIPSLTVTAGADPAASSTLATMAFSYTGANTEFAYAGNKFGGQPITYANAYRIEGTDYTLYVGPMGSDWVNAFYAVIDEAHAVSWDNVTLRADAEDGKPLMVFSGTFGDAYTTEAEAIAAVMSMDLSVQDNFSLQAYPNWTYHWRAELPVAAVPGEDGAEGTPAVEGNVTVVVDMQNRTFEVICDLTKAQTAFTANTVIYGHLNSNNMRVDVTAATVVYDGLQYRLGTCNESEIRATVNQYDSWLSGLTAIYITEAPAAEAPETPEA